MRIPNRMLRVLALLALSGFAGLLFAAPAWSAPAGQGKTGLPVMKWMQAYLNVSMHGGGYSPHMQMNFPLLWLYAPSGKAIGFFKESTSQSAISLLAHFPDSVAHAKTLSDEPTWTAMTKVLHMAGMKSVPQPAKDEYTAVLYITNTGCPVCSRLGMQLHATAARNPHRLHVVIVTFDVPEKTEKMAIPKGLNPAPAPGTG